MRIRNLTRPVICAAASGAMLMMAAPSALAASAAAGSSCWSAQLVQAAKLRQLDVLLMVGSLRCRSGAHDYRAAYDRFLLRHRLLLGKVNQVILTEMRTTLGSVGALDALDQASVRMANHYGEQTSYGCADLGEVTAALAVSGPEALPVAADVLVGEDVALKGCRVQVAVASVRTAVK